MSKHSVKIIRNGDCYLVECSNCSLTGVLTSKERAEDVRAYHKDGIMFPSSRPMEQGTLF